MPQTALFRTNGQPQVWVVDRQTLQVPARTVHYAGFTSLQVALTEQMQRLTHTVPAKAKAR